VWLEHLERMENSYASRILCEYKSKEKRDLGHEQFTVNTFLTTNIPALLKKS
jgi:hypothetical protein